MSFIGILRSVTTAIVCTAVVAALTSCASDDTSVLDEREARSEQAGIRHPGGIEDRGDGVAFTCCSAFHCVEDVLSRRWMAGSALVLSI